jgi:hypothetical protein
MMEAREGVHTGWAQYARWNTKLLSVLVSP